MAIRWNAIRERIRGEKGLCRGTFRRDEDGLCCVLGALAYDRRSGNFSKHEGLRKTITRRFGLSVTQQSRLMGINDERFAHLTEKGRRSAFLKLFRRLDFRHEIEALA